MNLEFWNKVENTNPKYVKRVSIGTRTFTAIDAQYQRKNATEQWGMYGKTWGIKNIRYEYIREIGSDGIAEKINEVAISGVFFYPDGEFEISSDMPYRTSKGFLVGDCRKKLLTDITTKGLSFLGFNADVFMGVFDGNKYTEEKAPHEKPMTLKQSQYIESLLHNTTLESHLIQRIENEMDSYNETRAGRCIEYLLENQKPSLDQQFKNITQ